MSRPGGQRSGRIAWACSGVELHGMAWNGRTGRMGLSRFGMALFGKHGQDRQGTAGNAEVGQERSGMVSRGRARSVT